MAAARAESDTPMPTTETVPDGATSTVTDEEWKAMADVLTNIYALRTKDGE